MTDQIVHMRDFQRLCAWQLNALHEFTKAIHETFLNTLLSENKFHVPSNHDIWFFLQGPVLVGFLWTEPQRDENSTTTLRVHGLYIDPTTTPALSKRVTKTFEILLQKKAASLGIKRLGFYTRRHLQAFMRRLNRTAPKKKPWTLDSYVLTRPV